MCLKVQLSSWRYDVITAEDALNDGHESAVAPPTGAQALLQLRTTTGSFSFKHLLNAFCQISNRTNTECNLKKFAISKSLFNDLVCKDVLKTNATIVFRIKHCHEKKLSIEQYPFKSY